jgi:hypothetical protein
VARPERFELPTFWFVAIRVKILNALFGIAYGLETPFFPQLAAPNPAPKTELYRTCTDHFMDAIRKAEFGFGEPTSWSRTNGQNHIRGGPAGILIIRRTLDGNGVQDLGYGMGSSVINQKNARASPPMTIRAEVKRDLYRQTRATKSDKVDIGLDSCTRRTEK